MDGQNFKNFVITILQVNKIDSVRWSVGWSVSRSVRQAGGQVGGQTGRRAAGRSVGRSVSQLVSQTDRQSDLHGVQCRQHLSKCLQEVLSSSAVTMFTCKLSTAFDHMFIELA